jgi:hypothetical protein
MTPAFTLGREVDELRSQIRYARAMIEFIRENRDHNPTKADAAIERECQRIHQCERRIELLRYEVLSEGCAR